jgi:DNA-binding CsgD family transcriptional regulator
VRSWGLSAQEQEELCRRWRQGESLQLIARRIGKRGPSVRAFVLQTGGVQQRPPQRAARSLTAVEREEISRGVAAGDSSQAIAKRLTRAPSTVSRELARNGRQRYRAQHADAAADHRAARPKPSKLAVEPRLRAVVEDKLGLRWSPEQIAGWLRVAYPDDPTMRISHETIYRSLYVQRRQASPGDLRRCLRTGRAMRRPRGKRLPQGRGLASSSTRSRSASGPPRQTDARSRAIGKATWSSANALGGAHAGRADQPNGSAGRPAGRLAGCAGPPGADRGHGSAPPSSCAVR